MRTPLVRNGADERFLRDDQGNRYPYTFGNVYPIMYVTICRWYRSLPDPCTLTAAQIRFFYEGIRADLKEATKPRKGK